MSACYLLKTEPSEYSFADLQSDKETTWDGVHNPVALRNLSQMTPGTKLIIYETGDHKSAVGTATVVSVDISNPKNPAVELKPENRLPKRCLSRKSNPTSSSLILRLFARAASPSCPSLTPSTNS